MPIKESVTIDEVIGLLNELLEKDRDAVVPLFTRRMPCNKAIAEHPTVQVSRINGVDHLGVLGILNGFFGVDERNWGVLAMVVDEQNSDKILRFERMDKPVDNGSPH
jgi:hypothetical protein